MNLHSSDAVEIKSQQGFCGISKADSKIYMEKQSAKSKQNVEETRTWRIYTTGWQKYTYKAVVITL